MKSLLHPRKNIILIVAALLVFMSLIWQVFVKEEAVLGSATLTWNASSEKNVTGYNVYYGSKKRTGDCPKGGYAKKVGVGNKTSYEIKNLKDGGTYYFSVTSVNDAGKESCFSEEMSKEIKISFWDKIKSLLN